jgi:hypothetical protein
MKKTKRPILVKRDLSIYSEFERLFNEKGLRIEVIYKKLSLKYFLSEQSIQKIVLNQAKIKQSRKNENASL